jgi:hypothetical protein
MYHTFVQFPSAARLPSASQRIMGLQAQDQQETLIVVVGFLVIVLGILLGTVVGPLQSIDMVLTPYGFTWIAGFVMTVLVLSWEIFAVSGAQQRFLEDDAVWQTSSATFALQRLQGWQRLLRLTWVELGGFGVILLCMVLMHYGY